MSYLINNQQKLNEIVFAGRNKNYGAYVIRSTYGNTIFKSLFFMMTGLGILTLTTWFLFNREQTVDLTEQLLINDRIYDDVLVNLKPEHEKPAQRNVAAANKPSNTKPSASTTPVIIDSLALAEPAAQPQARGTETAEATQPGDAAAGKDEGENNKPFGNGKGKEEEVQQLYGVDSQPEFEGGLAALNRFILNNVRYPEIARSEGQEGTVHVKFVVDENGNVGNITLLNKRGFGLDEEALRVIGLVPKFKSPAKVNGHPVKVYYQMPIRFRLR